MKIPIRNVYYLLCYAWGHLDERDLVDRSALEGFDGAADLLAKVLAEGVFRLVRRGIDHGYREITDEIAGVRGKLEVGAMATRAVRARGRTVCTFETFTPDVLHNRIVRSTLALLLRLDGLDRGVREDVALAYDRMEGVRTIPLSRRLFRRVQLDRNQRIYRFLLAVCALVLDSLLVDEAEGDVRFRDFREDEARMWALFEDFALEFFRRELEGWRVMGQKRVPWAGLRGRTPADEGAIPGMRPDVLLESAERRVILDTKFYSKPLRGHYGARKLPSGNLYQLLAYLENRQAALPDGPRHEGILLYAAVEESFRIEVELQGFRVQGRSVDLSRRWVEVQREMLGVVDDAAANPAGTAI